MSTNEQALRTALQDMLTITVGAGRGDISREQRTIADAQRALALPVTPVDAHAAPASPSDAEVQKLRRVYQLTNAHAFDLPDDDAFKAVWTESANELAEILDAARDRVLSVTAPVAATQPSEALEEMRQRKDAAYEERNRVVAALASCFPSGVARTAIEGWSEDWHGCVYIDLPTGQASWHFHDSHAHLFAHLPPYPATWDGHTTNEKYRRLASLAATQPSEGSSAEGAEPEEAAGSSASLPGEQIWTCSIGGAVDYLPPGADWPLRKAVERAYLDLTGKPAAFNFTGWGGKLTASERFVADAALQATKEGGE